MDKLLDEIESYWSTRTEGYSEVNEKELNGMQKKAWLETLERGFLGKRSGKNEDSENNSMEKPKKKQSINIQNGKKHRLLIVQIYLLLLEPIKIGYLPIRS